MSLLDPSDPQELHIKKQAKIIEALMRRASRQKDLGPSAFLAFQSAIELQQQVDAQSRDLARATTELESERYERMRTRRALVEALSSMEEGFALFIDGQLNISNDLFSNLMPDISEKMDAGLLLEDFFLLLASSQHLKSTERPLSDMARELENSLGRDGVASVVLGLDGDRWYQLIAQYTETKNILILLTEITAIVRRNRSEKKTLIDRQADYLQAIFQHMSSGMCTFSADGQVMMHNPQFQKILNVPDRILSRGISLSELFSYMADQNLIRSDDAPKYTRWRDELDKKGWTRRRVSYGDGRVVEIHANLLPDGGFVVELMDVTLEARTTETLENRVAERTAELTRANDRLTNEYEEKARVEEQLRVAIERAEAAVSSKTRFLAAASHDLLQPINAAKLLLSTLQSLTRGGDLERIVERLEGSFSSAEQLLHSLLDISRLESAEPDQVSLVVVNLGEIMESVFADQALVAEQKQVALYMVSSSVHVRSDPVYLLRSLQNLVVNAIQYTEPGGRVLFGCRRAGDKVLLQVWDTGIGIETRDQGRILEEFTRAENVPVGTGMGLGLSVVDRACRLLGHGLSIRSDPGRGSVFSIEMKMVEGLALPREPEPPEMREDETPINYVILVVENNRDVLYGTTTWLEQRGARVLPARNAEDALTLVKEFGRPPDVIMADYELDFGETGLRVIQAIREETRTHVPAFLVTADRRDVLRQDANRCDVSTMIKPLKLSRLRPFIHWKVSQSEGPRHHLTSPKIAYESRQ